MELINLAEKQIEHPAYDDKDTPFFKEYFQSFHSNTHFWEDTHQLMHAYNIQDVAETVSFLESMTKQALYHINDNLHRDIDFDIITFFGDCSYDGHGMLIDSKPYVFFDLNAVIPRLDFYNFKAFVTHEVLHSIHYFLNPDFYRGNYRTVEEGYLKLLFSEGIATHLSYVLSNEKIEDTYWFGYLTTEKVWEWVTNCESRKNEIGIALDRVLDTGNSDRSLYNRLFGIDDFTMPASYRLGYYYGAEIVKGLLAKRNMNDCLTLKYHEAEDSVKAYF